MWGRARYCFGIAMSSSDALAVSEMLEDQKPD